MPFFSFPSGWLADKIGVKTTFLTGLLLYIAVYSGFAFADSESWYWALFLLYGLYAAATEGISKAWISLVTPATETATAIGLYTSAGSIAAFIASSLAGIIWWQAGASWAFGVTAAVAVLVWIYLAMMKESGNIAKAHAAKD
jgi:MFS family permease